MNDNVLSNEVIQGPRDASPYYTFAAVDLESKATSSGECSNNYATSEVLYWHLQEPVNINFCDLWTPELVKNTLNMYAQETKKRLFTMFQIPRKQS